MGWPMNAWLTIGLLQTIFVALVLARRAQVAPASIWLFAWLAIAFVHQLSIYVSYAHPDWVSSWLAIGLGLLPFLHGPVAFGYVSAFLPNRMLARTAPLHIAPFLATWVIALVIDATAPWGLTIDATYAVTTLHDATGAQIAWPPWAMALSGGVYPLAGFILLRRARPVLLSTRSDVSTVNFRWLEIWIFGHLAAFALIFAVQFALTTPTAMALTSWVLAAEVFYLGVFGVWGFERTKEASPTASRTRAKIPSKTIEQDAARLVGFMKEEKPYQRPALTLSALADASGLSEATISAAVKEAGYKHFFDFVNAFRCEEVKAKIDRDPFGAESLLAIALDAGFNSKSAFNRVFKSRVGVTPSQYRDRASGNGAAHPAASTH